MKIARIYHSGVVSDWRERERQMRKAGLDVTFISPRRWNEGGSIAGLDGTDDFVRPVATLGSHPYRFVYGPFALIRALRSGVSLVDVHEEPASLAAAEVLFLRWLCRATAVPLVFYSAQNIYKRYPPPFRWFERRFLRRAAAAYVCNAEAADVLIKKGFAGTIEVIPLGIDRHLFDDDDAAPTGAPGGYVVGYVGRLERHKGVSVLLDALTLVPNASLEVVGDGPLRSELERRATELGLGERVRFLGSVERQNIASVYRRFDVLAVPSLTTSAWKEQFGRVVAEAMSVGTPVVASDSGSLPEVVGPGGVLVPPGDAVALGSALRELEDPARRAELGAAALRWAKQFAWEAVAAQHQRVYTRVLGRDCMRVSVVVVTFESAQTIEGCLRSIPRDCEVIVVDNASTDRSAELATGAYVTRNEENRGFAAGANQGAALATGEFVLFLNPDAELDDGCIDRLVATMDVRDDLAIVAPAVIRSPTGDASSSWPFPAAHRTWANELGLQRLVGRRRTRNGFVVGTCMLVRRDWFARLGGFDERFWLYAEDADLCWRSRALGGQNAVVAGASVGHIGAHSSDQLPSAFEHFHRGAELFIARHAGRVALTSHRVAVLAGAVIRAAVFLPANRTRSRWFSRLAARELKVLARYPTSAAPAPQDPAS